HQEQFPQQQRDQLTWKRDWRAISRDKVDELYPCVKVRSGPALGTESHSRYRAPECPFFRSGRTTVGAISTRISRRPNQGSGHNFNWRNRRGGGSTVDCRSVRLSPQSI